MLDKLGVARICGFRQLKRFGQAAIHEGLKFAPESVEWAAPEVLAQNSIYSTSADIYSLGITSLELAFNQTPYRNWPPMKILLCKKLYECPNIKTTKTTSKLFRELVGSCLKKSPESRLTLDECLNHRFVRNRSHKALKGFLKNLIDNN
jgi:serine/threonine protein kinase